MTNEKKAELIALLKGAEKKPRKAYSVRMENDLFEKIEGVSIRSGKTLNDVLNALIELGLAEYEKA